MPEFPVYSPQAEFADTLILSISIAIWIIGAIALNLGFARNFDASSRAVIATYSVCGLAMFAASAFYNVAPPSHVKSLLRIADHSAIVLMICGTYTPTIYFGFSKAVRGGLLAGYWAIGLAGIGLRIAAPALFEAVDIPFYLALGWGGLVLAAVASRWAPRFDATAYRLLVAGGVIYSVGIVFLNSDHLEYHNAIWHGFVLAAAATQYFAVVRFVAVHRERAVPDPSIGSA